ncbi:hypothetical protein DFP74_6681 [Nocardiopsis sp. Huas11]|uniref:hypothetical protein n=1 Tax=Nocardiopsis sp. Huas11 TaxID=2183912 RepID=UPI000EAD8F12|nr:hypothetical protein [Nocardiopsis sp. Huas11]RKR98960.1 hypothetical protein DFP74_6681 [Nocardiopsis sp. Huas11]
MKSADQLCSGDLVAINHGYFGDRARLARRLLADYPGAVVTGITRTGRYLQVHFRYLDTDVHGCAKAYPDDRVAVA